MYVEAALFAENDSAPVSMYRSCANIVYLRIVHVERGRNEHDLRNK